MEAALSPSVAITLPDGSVRTFDAPVTGATVAASIGPGLAKQAIAAKIDGEIRDLDLPIEQDASLAIITRQSEEALELIRHDCAHVMAEAVQGLFPGTQVTIGPAIADGFYYDFAREEPFTPEDFEAIEARMREIVKADAAFEREVWDRNEAIAFFEERGERYKAELIRDLPESETITIYRQGDWLDLCRGPHMPSTSHVGQGFKLTKLAGAYWRGDHRNPMLQRIYGTAWRNEKELKAYLHQLEEAEKRDHRRLGREMDLFHFQEESPGSVFWHPNGWTIYLEMERYIRRRLAKAGYSEVRTPQLIDQSLYTASGHWDMYGDNMFKIQMGEDRAYGLKPMNCPGHVQIFKQGIVSYRDLPIRMAEFGCCHRNEASGALHGLLRVRQMTQDDAHIFCTEDQVEAESVAFCDLLAAVYRDLGFESFSVKLATRPDKRAGSDAVWDKAEADLEAAVQAAGIDYTIEPGEGAFYGPKLEFHLVDAIGRSWQCGTLQLDFVLPERLDATYVDEQGDRQRPVMLHRAILGSLERFIAVLIEHNSGHLPLWLSPVQMVVATITNEADAYAGEVAEALEAAGLRVHLDLRNEKIGYKIREHSVNKVPAILVVGGREAENRKVAVRRLGSKDQSVLDLDEAVKTLKAEAATPLDRSDSFTESA
ncbi:MAG: threonine--tRNA ligase [Pseudomonadota bacterium]